jgi:cytochrome c oxidase subunit II
MKKCSAVVAIMVLVIAGVSVLRPRPARAQSAPRIIEVHAKRFGFTPNLVTVKKGEAVKIHLVSDDVTHGFFSRPLKIDGTAGPGSPADIDFAPSQPGKYTIICDHFCGAGHGNMGMSIVVEE